MVRTFQFLRQSLVVVSALIAAASGIAADNDRPSTAATNPATAELIRGTLATQVEAWNRGDIDTFMQTYWKSPELTFSSGGKTTRGWQETLDGYKKRYPTPERMGKVRFEELEIYPLGDEAALVLGRWNLQREQDPIGGNFSLVFRKFGDRWLIIHDHTSQQPPPPGGP
jgi:beta-aspartyl-peptidase (threonine type)